jgi:hypothetical protein
MNQMIMSARVDAFDRAFPKTSHREHWLTMYLALRDSGDNHSTAVETIRGEKLMEQFQNARKP